ncbi:MAG: hypothetical protein HQL34_09710 [Alphaproteobacteria bacterium]|nr:hypothetical protein [Alphaproteobacteria bacterium]
MTTPAVVPLSVDRAEHVRRFLRAIYGEGHYGAETRYFDWLYQESPCRWFAEDRRRRRLPVNAILDGEGGLAAVHAYLPFDARTPWGGEVGVWDVEWINGSGVRGGGRALAAHLLGAVDVYGGFGCNDLSIDAFARLGMAVVPEVRRLVALIDADAFRRLLAEAGRLDEAGPLPRAASVGTARGRILDAPSLVPRAALDDVREQAPFAAERTAEWLEWRYDRHPFIPYLGVEAAGGAAVLRLETVVGTGARVCRMLDFFPRSGGEAELLAAALSVAGDNRALLFDYICASGVQAERVGAAARSLEVDMPANPRLPYMFQPLEFARANAPNMVLAIGGRAGAVEADLGEFQAGKGDSNQDVLRDPATAPRMARKN